jgi:hypothetical protein
MRLDRCVTEFFAVSVAWKVKEFFGAHEGDGEV